MTTVSTKTLQEALSYVTDVTLRDGYSGRGMFGDTCFGLDANSIADATLFLVHLAQIDANLAVTLTENMATDGMGMGVIVYFPGYTLDEPLPDDEDDEEWV